MKVAFRIFALLFLFSSCLNKADVKDEKANLNALFYDYQVWGEEGREDVTVRLQFRAGGPNGATMILPEPGNVTLDGVPLPADSAMLTGNFYETMKPAQHFAGTHRIVFTDLQGKKHKEEFTFEPFSLAQDFPERLKKEPFTFRLQPFPASANIRLVIIDTSFASPDVNQEMVIKNGEVNVGIQQLTKLTSGPVTLEIYREEERPLKAAGKKGGRLQLTYGLRRQFEFVE